MTLDWPTVVLALGAMAASVTALKMVLPVVSASSERARQQAVEELGKRLTAVEASLIERRLPGRLR